ncbi:hypothetical protein RJ639_024371 [Escallonia herrerae]|uniref:Trichome birefringence-like N-terminal domain-containing protein n=1 Tax=Escallonia herrerae TaxID=1293975 RepID=A0AA88V0B9_9ASTE|nr:hypothetical protein RJ639_024371 [Escallonia herrerae]
MSMTGNHRLVHQIWKVSYNLNSLVGLLVTALVVAAVYLAGDSSRLLTDQETLKNPILSCDFFSGKWVYDNKSQPLYKEQNCSFMLDDFACEKSSNHPLTAALLLHIQQK